MGVIYYKCVFVSDNLFWFNNCYNDFFLIGMFNICYFEKNFEEFVY